MFVAINKEYLDVAYSGDSLNAIYTEMREENYHSVEDFNFFKGDKINVRVIEPRLEMVSEVKKPATVRKPAVKSKK